MTTPRNRSLDGTGELVRLALRRDRLRLAIWVLGLVGVTWFSAEAMGTTFGTQRSIDTYAASVAASPALVAMTGPPLGLDTLAGIVLNKVGSTALIGTALIAILTVVRHTRSEEEEGRSEMLRATVVGRHAGSAAALWMAVLASLVVGVGTALAVHAAAVPSTSSWLFGMSVAALGVVFAAVALVAAQVFTHARTALGVSLAVLGVSFVVRAAGDVGENGLVWLSPIGWSQATHVLGGERRWPLLVPLLASVLMVGVATWLADHRDVGAGLVAARSGAPEASRSLSGPVALALRLQRGSLLGWGGGLFVLSAAMGSLSREVAVLAKDPALSRYLAQNGQGSPTDAFFSTMLLVIALLAAAFSVSSTLRMRGEETSGRLEALLATGLSRTRWMLGSLLVTLAGTVLILLVSGLGFGLSYGLVVSDATAPLRMAGLMAVYIPAAMALAGLAALLVGWLPRAVSLAWAVFAVCFVLGWLGGLIDPPRWLEQLSPFWHTPTVPVEAVTFAAPATITLSVVLLVGAAVLGLRRRDVAP